NEGRTSDAEFAAMVSLLPLDHGAVAFRYPANHYVAFPQLLADRGYQTLSAVPFEPGFWNRRVMHPLYGFQHSLFESDFTMTEQIGWGLNDHDFLQQMVPRLETLRRPFCAWLITLSLHHPFDDFPDAHKVLRLGARDRTSFGNYLHTMRFFDQALDDFRTALASRDLLGASDDPPVVRPYGDWLDRERLFLSGGGAASSCYDLAARAFADGHVCAAADAAARKARDVSRFLIAEDLQQRMLVQSAPR